MVLATIKLETLLIAIVFYFHQSLVINVIIVSIFIINIIILMFCIFCLCFVSFLYSC
jgi:hypothetical protein